MGAHKTPPTATLKAFEPDIANFLFSADLSVLSRRENGHRGVSVVLLVLTARDAEPSRLCRRRPRSEAFCSDRHQFLHRIYKKHFPMFVSAGLSLLYDVWPKPVRPVLFCLHLWDLHDLQQRGWHGFNGGLPAPGSLRRRGHDDTGSRASPGWVEGRETRCGGRVKKQRNVQKIGFSSI